jgi:hypothetical protein
MKLSQYQRYLKLGLEGAFACILDDCFNELLPVFAYAIWQGSIGM